MSDPFTTVEALGVVLKQRGGSIVNVGSMSGFIVNEGARTAWVVDEILRSFVRRNASP